MRHDLADKMLTARAKSYDYDAAGRTVGINAPGGTTTLTYDYESRVTAITGPGINETHTYNGLDTRVGTVQGGVSRTFVRDGSYVTDPVLRDGQATYTPGVSERRGGVSTWSHSGLKNADAQTTSVGAIAATRVYDAFGAELSATGTWKGPFGYAGGFGYQEDSSGLKLLGHRYYDPTTGRFLSRDPAKDGRNWYVYCWNNPLFNHDAAGLEKIVIVKAGQSDPDIEGYTNDIIGDYKKRHPDDEIVVVESAEAAYKELEDADALVVIGHFEPQDGGKWDPENSSSIETKLGDRLDPHKISKKRKGERLKWINLVCCNSLSNPGMAAAWGRLSNGNLWGAYRLINIRHFAWGWVRLEKYDPRFKPSGTWWGGRKKSWF